MKTLYEVIDGGSGDAEKIKRAGEILKAGGLVAFPTETVYGLGGDALNPGSSRKIYAAKGRPSDNPLIVHICRISDLERIAWDPDGRAARTAEAFWPGPLTMILKKKDVVPMETTGGLDTVAVRFPSHPVAQRLIDAAGLKGLRVGDAQVSEKHAGFIVNLGHASARDILALMDEVKARVLAASGVTLEPEVRILGEDA